MEKSEDGVVAGLFLFLKTLYDFNPYLRNPDEQERLINMPPQIKLILREIISSQIIAKLIIDNENRKAEEKKKAKKRRQEEKRKGFLGAIQPTQLKGDNYEKNLKLIQNKRSLNTSCFNQRSIPSLNQYYNSINEMMCIKDSVIEKIQKIECNALMSCIDLEKRNRVTNAKFILINPHNKDDKLDDTNIIKNKQRKIIEKNKINLDMLLTRGFMSLDDYYKFIKNNLKKFNGFRTNTENMELFKKNIKIFDEDDNKVRINDRKKNNKTIESYNTENKVNLPIIKKKGKSVHKMDYVYFNKDVKFQVKRSIDRNKKSLKIRQLLHCREFDYKNILSLFHNCK